VTETVEPLRRVGLPAAITLPRLDAETLVAPAVRRRDIQGLRAVAVLLVIAFHAGVPLPGGFLGVDVFFAISGFVITRMLLHELETTGRLDLPRFYARRVKRLLPAMALMVTVVAALGTLASTAAAQRDAGLTGAAASVFGANIRLALQATGYFDARATLDPFLHTWSLGVEEQFYLFFPALLVAGWLFAARRTVVTGALLAICAASLALSFALAGGLLVADSGLASRLAFYGSPVRAWEFAAGALVALAAPRAAKLSPGAVRILGVAGLAAVALAARRTDANDLLAVAGACVLLAAGAGRRLGASRALEARPVVWLGDLSYSLYLWHWPLIVFAQALWPGSGWAAPVAAAASLLPAWASYRYVENPIRFSGIGGRRVVTLAAACIAVPIAASAGLLAAERMLSGTESMKSWERSQALHADVMRGCDQAAPAQGRAAPCTWTVPAAKGEVVLFGDSNAGQFTEPVVRAANRAGFDATVTTHASCPPLGLRVAQAGGEVKACDTFGVDTVKRLVASRPSLVVLAARTDKYLRDSAFGLGGELTHDSDRKAVLWNSSLRTILARLNAAHVPVVLVHPVPTLPRAPQECPVVRVLLRRCDASIARSAVDARLGLSTKLEAAAAASTSDTWTIDFADQLCPHGRCASARDGIVQYRDTEHLSVDGALKLTRTFFQAIEAHARRS
jgi:peptidoglycan/LPS O-acetylase OafA/YrhL